MQLAEIAVALFGLDVARLARRPTHDLVRLTPAVVAADLSWVVFSVVALLLGWFSGGGVAVVIATAVAVDTFAFLQFSAWRQLRRTH